MDDAPPHLQPEPFSPTARMAKARTLPASSVVSAAQPAARSYRPRGRKRPADDSTHDASPADSNAMHENTEATPRDVERPADKSIPRGQTSDESQPPPARRARTDVEPLNATGSICTYLL